MEEGGRVLSKEVIKQKLQVNHGHISEDSIPFGSNIGDGDLFYHGTGEQDDPFQIDETQRSKDEPYFTLDFFLIVYL